MKPRNITPLNCSLQSLKRIIYVVELDPAVAYFPAFARANPQFVPGGLCVYVGSTTLTAEERFSNHLAGVQASEIVRRFGRALRMDLVPPQVPIQRKWALKKEKNHARELRSQGIGAYQN